MALGELAQGQGPIPHQWDRGGGHPPPSPPRCGVTPQYLPFVFQGNDQVRFELTCYALCPKIKVRHPKSNHPLVPHYRGPGPLPS